MAADYVSSGKMSKKLMQKLLEDAEQELAELYALQTPPPPVDAATQTQPLEDVIFSRSTNPADRSIQCNWLIEHSLTIEFKGNYNWSSMYEDVGIFQTRIIGNTIWQFAKKSSKARKFLLETFGNTMTVTRGLHKSSNDYANPHGFPHFNAVDCDGQTIHVYCKRGMNPRFVHIVSFSKILVVDFSTY